MKVIYAVVLFAFATPIFAAPAVKVEVKTPKAAVKVEAKAETKTPACCAAVAVDEKSNHPVLKAVGKTAKAIAKAL